MPTFKTPQQLFDHLTKQVMQGMEKVGDHGVDKTKEHLQKDVYDSYDPKVYDRTMEVMESIEHTKPVRNDEEVAVVIHSNSDKVIAHSPNQHHSIVEGYDPQDFSERVVETIVKGTSGHIFGEGAWTSKRPFFDHAKEDMESTNSHTEVLKKALKAKGINVI